MTLTEFLTARLDEDEVSATPGRRALDDLRFDLKRGDHYEQHLSSRIEDGLDAQTSVWEALVRREVEAKRKILAEHRLDDSSKYRDLWNCTTCCDPGEWERPAAYWPCDTVRALAAVYSDHPDYDKEWA